MIHMLRCYCVLNVLNVRNVELGPYELAKPSVL